MALLVDAYSEYVAPITKGGDDKRTVPMLDPRLAPVKVAVLPLSKSADLVPRAEQLAATLRQHWNVEMDSTQAIGRRYRRQDEIGTDRKSTRLNSSHVAISYAVFCSQKKT